MNKFLFIFANRTTEALLYFSVLWAPWAFGSVHQFSITILNISNYLIGLLLLLKVFLRRIYKYNTPYWSYNHFTSIHELKKDKCKRTYLTFLLTAYLLVYISISLLNIRATYVSEYHFFEYSKSFLYWLPSTYDKVSTTNSLINFCGLACCFWGFRDWFLTKSPCLPIAVTKDELYQYKLNPSNRHLSTIPSHLEKIIWLLGISAGLLALIGVIQKYDNTLKLLWFFERSFQTPYKIEFGPFGYRSNAASYLNLVIPLLFGILINANNNSRFRKFLPKQFNQDFHHLLLPIVAILIIGVLSTLSRGGIAVLGIITLFFFIHIFSKKVFVTNANKFVFSCLILLGFIAFLGLGWEPLYDRFTNAGNSPQTLNQNIQNDDYNFVIEKIKLYMNSRYEIYENLGQMAYDFKWFGCGLGAWSKVYFLYHDTNQIWEAWAHCDLMQYWISLGLFGFLPGIILLMITNAGKPTKLGFYIPNSLFLGVRLAIGGCIIHSLIDYPLNVMSIMHLFVILCVVKMHCLPERDK